MSDVILLAHGSGGLLSQELVETIFLPHLGHPDGPLEDAAEIALAPGRVVMTTDGYVVRPLTFPGGDIGTLAVCGTVNDLAMRGARPLYLTAGFILEEGFPLAELDRPWPPWPGLPPMRACASSLGTPRWWSGRR